jgi:hypothetical protein
MMGYKVAHLYFSFSLYPTSLSILNAFILVLTSSFLDAQIGQRMVEAFSHQIFISGFVHADPHPGVYACMYVCLHVLTLLYHMVSADGLVSYTQFEIQKFVCVYIYIQTIACATHVSHYLALN